MPSLQRLAIVDAQVMGTPDQTDERVAEGQDAAGVVDRRLGLRNVVFRLCICDLPLLTPTEIRRTPGGQF